MPRPAEYLILVKWSVQAVTESRRLGAELRRRLLAGCKGYGVEMDLGRRRFLAMDEEGYRIHEEMDRW